MREKPSSCLQHYHGEIPIVTIRVLATEQASIGGLKVLNYAPGPMDTDMSKEIRSPEQYEEDLKSGNLVDPRLSAEKCVRLAVRGTFVTGSHVDFFDEETEKD